MSYIDSILRSGDALATNNRVDFTKDGWQLEVLRSHPLYTGAMKFPPEFLDNFHIIFAMQKTGKIVTPDEKSVAEWKKNPRPSLLEGGEKKDEYGATEADLYDAFKVMTENTLKMNYNGSNRTHNKATSITFLTFNTIQVRHRLNDEKLMRFQQEYWRETIYELLAKQGDGDLDGKTIAESATAEGEDAVPEGDAMKESSSNAEREANDKPKDASEGVPNIEDKDAPAEESKKEQGLLQGLVSAMPSTRPNNDANEMGKRESKDDDHSKAPASDSKNTVKSMINQRSRLM